MSAISRLLPPFGDESAGCGWGGFAQAVREAVAGDALASELINAMLSAGAALWKEYCRLHDLVVELVASHELRRRFIQIPGVGPIAALSFVTAIDDPSRFKRSGDVAAYFGLTPRRRRSGSSIGVQGRISKAGDGERWTGVIIKLCEELREAQRHTFLLAHNSATTRLAMFLDLQEHLQSLSDETASEIFLPMDRSSIAAYLGLTLAAVSRAFRSLIEEYHLRPRPPSRHNSRQGRLQQDCRYATCWALGRCGGLLT